MKNKKVKYFDKSTVIKHVIKNEVVKKAVIFVPMSALYMEGVRILMHLN